MRIVKVVGLLPLVVAAGCVVPQSRYDRLQTEYHAENQARRQLEDEVQRRDGDLSAMRSKLAEKDSSLTALEQDAAQSKERIAQLEQALKDAQAATPSSDTGDIQIVRTPDGFAYRIADKLLFDPGSTEIRENGRKALLTIASEIKDKGYTAVRIDGHTDSDPVVKTKDKWKLGNYELAVERALSVFGVLTRDGKVPEAVFTLVGWGPSRPLVDNKSDADKARNRRVEIHVAVPKQS